MILAWLAFLLTNTAALQQRNQSVHSDFGQNFDWSDTATSLAQLYRKNFSTRNFTTTHPISQSLKAEHEQKNKLSEALTTRATFRSAANAMSSNDISTNMNSTNRPCGTYDCVHHMSKCNYKYASLFLTDAETTLTVL